MCVLKIVHLEKVALLSKSLLLILVWENELWHWVLASISLSSYLLRLGLDSVACIWVELVETREIQIC